MHTIPRHNSSPLPPSKIATAAFQRAPLQAHPYEGPVQLKGTEAVLARCGNAERLLVRVAVQLPADTQGHNTTAGNSTAAAGSNCTAQAAAPAQPLSSGGSSDAEVPLGRGAGCGFQATNITTAPDSEGQAAAAAGNGTSTAEDAATAQPPSGDSSSSSAEAPSASNGTSNGTGAGVPKILLRNITAGPEDQPLNVLVILVDALQRRHFFRRLPKTAAALEALPASSGGATTLYQFFRHHIVGLNTGE